MNIERAIKDFSYFCKQLQFPQRQWNLPPNDKNIGLLVRRPLILAKHQKEIIQKIESMNRELVINKSRQIGITTLMLIYYLWNVLYKKGWYGVFISDTLPKCRKLFREIVNALDYLPDELKVEISNWYQELGLYNEITGSKMNFQVASPSAARGETFSISFVDEFDFYTKTNQLEVSSALLASTPKTIFSSTPKVFNGEFSKKCDTARLNGNLIEIPIQKVIENKDFFGSKLNGQKWLNHLTKGKSLAMVNREYNCSFVNIADQPVLEIPYDRWLEQREDTAPFIVSIDIGWVDYTYCTIAKAYKNKLHIIDELEVSRSSIKTITDKLKQRVPDGKFLYGICDSSGKKVEMTAEKTTSVWKQLQENLGVRFYTRKPHNKIEGVKNLQSAIYEGELWFDRKKLPKLFEMLEILTFNDHGKIPHTYGIDRLDSLLYLHYNWCKLRNKPSERKLYTDIGRFFT